MAIKKFKSYDSVKPYGDYEALPVGGYVLRIMDARAQENQYGQYVQVRLDIEEGDYKGYFMNDYQSQEKEDKKWHCTYLLNVPKDDGSERDGWTARRFKTFTSALEDSNEGYHFDWDETKFKDKLIGGLFNEREYKKADGSIGRVTNLAQVCDINKVRSGNYKLPKDKLLNGDQGGGTATEGFINVPEGAADEIPWD
ncbi:MAG: hypothetical protein LUD47_00255 [Clostridia bacterium]|nr:hypothetical protein [Clostridia bacterium]